ncbi:MAG TPA: MauE/DoxX family redox-associated membrane protein [Actinomycetes bacterium]|nr:MauE/DoxX family redox-associated membrane protein [Actinomycetes bacterium]
MLWLVGLAISFAVVAPVLLGTGLSKVLHRRAFRNAIYQQQLIPPVFAGAVSWVLPPIEVLLGLAVVLPWWQPNIAAGMLLAILASYSAVLDVKRAGIDCGCGGIGTFKAPPGWRESFAVAATSATAGLLKLAGRPVFGGIVAYVMFAFLTLVVATAIVRHIRSGPAEVRALPAEPARIVSDATSAPMAAWQANQPST